MARGDTVRFNPDAPRTKLKTVCGTDVFVNEQGIFCARIGRDLVSRRDLKELEKLLARNAGGVKVLRVGYRGNLPKVSDLVQMERTRYGGHAYRFSDHMVDSSSSVYLHDEQALAEFTELQKEFDAEQDRALRVQMDLEQRWNAIRSRLTPVTREVFETERAKTASAQAENAPEQPESGEEVAA